MPQEQRQILCTSENAEALVGGTNNSSEQLLVGYDNLERAKMARVSAHPAACHCYVCRAHISPWRQ